jgi:hypothetical protein
MEEKALFETEDDVKLQKFLGWSYSDTNLMVGFNAYKYKDIGMNVENPHYVYDKDGYLMAVICGDTKRKAIYECRKYIFFKRINAVPLIHYFNTLFNLHKK